jgi:hypothetical protein
MVEPSMQKTEVETASWMDPVRLFVTTEEQFSVNLWMLSWLVSRADFDLVFSRA